MWTKETIAKAEGFPLESIDAFVTWLGHGGEQRPYITTAGLKYKMEQKYGSDWRCQAEIVMGDELVAIRKSMGLSDSDPMVIMRGLVWAPGSIEAFVDYGTASPKNLKGFVKFADYGVEMAARRATNRAMRLATSTNLTSEDELPGQAEEEPADTAATEKQINLITSLSKSPALTEDERKKIEHKLGVGFGKREASGFIERLKAKIEERNGPEEPA